MSIKPTTLPRWARTALDVDAANIVVPASGEQDTGFTVGQTPIPSGKHNWLLNHIYKWIQFLNDSPAFVAVSANSSGLQATGTGTAAGLFGVGGSTNGQGVQGTGGAPNGVGVIGQGTGVAQGVKGVGGSTSGSGVTAEGGLLNGLGVNALGAGSGAGVQGTGGPTGVGVSGFGGATGGPGVIGNGTGGNQGVHGNGHVAGAGVTGTGGATGNGVEGSGGGTSGIGVKGTGTGGQPGLQGIGGVQAGTGNDFTYQTARTERFHLSPDEMITKSAGSTKYFISNNSAPTIQEATAGTAATIEGKVRIPQGALLTDIELLLGQDGTSPATATVTVYEHVFQLTTPFYVETIRLNGALAAIPVSGVGGIFTWGWVAVAITDFTIVTDGFIHIKIDLPAIATRFAGFGGMRVTYTIPHLKPSVS